jgi:hypothetical protein
MSDFIKSYQDIFFLKGLAMCNTCGCRSGKKSGKSKAKAKSAKSKKSSKK